MSTAGKLLPLVRALHHRIREQVVQACANQSTEQLSAVAQDQVFSTEEICRKNYQTAMEYKKNAKYHDAEEFFALVVETCPDQIDAYLNLGYVQTQLEQYPDAIDTYQRALEHALAVHETTAASRADLAGEDEFLTLGGNTHRAKKPAHVPIHSTPSRSSYIALTLSLLRLWGSSGSCRKWRHRPVVRSS